MAHPSRCIVLLILLAASIVHSFPQNGVRDQQNYRNGVRPYQTNKRQSYDEQFDTVPAATGNVNSFHQNNRKHSYNEPMDHIPAATGNY